MATDTARLFLHEHRLLPIFVENELFYVAVIVFYCLDINCQKMAGARETTVLQPFSRNGSKSQKIANFMEKQLTQTAQYLGYLEVICCCQRCNLSPIGSISPDLFSISKKTHYNLI